MKNALAAIVPLLVLSGMCVGQEAATAREEPETGVVTAHFRGLHGYIGYSASRPADRTEYGMGMGFYAAVWPLIDKPIAHFQIGLPSAWITPDNSDNKDKPLAPVGTSDTVPLRPDADRSPIGRRSGVDGVWTPEPVRED